MVALPMFQPEPSPRALAGAHRDTCPENLARAAPRRGPTLSTGLTQGSLHHAETVPLMAAVGVAARQAKRQQGKNQKRFHRH